MDKFLIILLAAAALAGIIWAAVVAERKRRTVLKAVAQNLGLAFDPEVDRRLHHSYGHQVFKKGHSRQASNNMLGTMRLAGYDLHIRMGDYRYVTGHGKHQHTHRISYAAFKLPFIGTPNLLIRREGIGDKLVGGMGFDDIDFESEEFSRAFWVKSENEKHAYDVVHPQMMEFLLEGSIPHLEIVHDVCLLLKGWSRWDAETFHGAPGRFEGFFELWPEHLVDRLRLEGPKQMRIP